MSSKSRNNVFARKRIQARKRGGGQASRGGRGSNVSRFSAVAGNGRNAAQGAMGEGRLPTIMVRSKPLFGYRTRRVLQYYDTASIITGTAQNNSYVFSVNGCYDPNISGTGAQPMGFDQMMAFYNHYTCLKATIKVIASNTGSIPVMFGIGVSGTTTVVSDYAQLVESGDLVARQLCPLGTIGAMCELIRTVSSSKFQGVDDIMDDPNMRGDAASNPTEQMYFHLNTWNPYSATQVTTNFQVIITYDVIFHEPRTSGRSLIPERKEPGPPVDFEPLNTPFEKVNSATVPIAYFLQNLFGPTTR